MFHNINVLPSLSLLCGVAIPRLAAYRDEKDAFSGSWRSQFYINRASGAPTLHGFSILQSI